MNDATELQVFLKAKAGEVRPEADMSLDLKKNVWLRSIDEFYERILAWLEPLAAEGIVRYEKKPTKVEEEPIGVYEVDSLTIYIGNQYVTFHPKGTLIVGAQGRIDLQGHRAARSIILYENQWFVVERTPRIKMLPFNERSFQDILSEVME